MFKGYRTRIFAFIIATLGGVQATDLAFIPSDALPYVMIGIAAIVAVLREMTNTAAGSSE